MTANRETGNCRIRSVPETTIITGTYNKPGYLRDAAETVRQQTVSAWRWWIVLDGADDETTSLASLWAKEDSRITVFEESTSEEQRKSEYRPAAVINTYFPCVETPCLCWLSDDDLLEPRFLQVLAGEITSISECEIAFGHCEVVIQTGPDDWRHRRWLRANRSMGKGTRTMPDCVIDGGQFVQSKRSYDALDGYQLPTSHATAHHVDGLYMNRLARQFTFFPVDEKVVTHRCTYLSTHQKAHLSTHQKAQR